METLTRNLIMLLLPMLLFFFCQGQRDINVAGMHLDYELVNDSLTISLEAPTQGWLALGFNTKNNIAGSDLLMFAMEEGQLKGEDQYVRRFNDHVPDAMIGGQHNLRLLNGEEKLGYTKIKFRIPLFSGDSHDFHHRPGQPFWLIIAYSQEDDFNHHSLVRKHLRFTWQ